MPATTAVLSQIREWIDRLPPATGGRALVLGAAGPWSAPLQARGYRVEVHDGLTEASLPPATFDLVVVVGWLERAPWDRWALQLCHRALADGGHLVLAAPNFHGLASPDGLGFLVARAARALGLRVRRALGAPPPRERFRGRRYRRGDLTRTLQHLGYDVESYAATDAGWLAPFSAFAPGIVRRLCRTHVLHARRGPSLFGVDPRRPFPDPAAHRRDYERTHGRQLAERAHWLARHPTLAPTAVATLDPAAAARGREVLVLCPHPDDELIGCGGTLAALIAQGARVTILHATDGSEAASLWHAPPEVRRTVRLEEARRVGELMGFASLLFWKEDNARFVGREEHVGELAAVLARLRPAFILTPFVTDIHRDHRALTRMLARAIKADPAVVADSIVLSYAVWSAVPANLTCDIGPWVGLQEQALFLYATAMKVDDYVHFCQDRNYHDAVVLTGRPGFVEGFHATPAGAFPTLAATMEGSDA